METTKKFEVLYHEPIEYGSGTMYRIRAIRSFSDVKKGDMGGFVRDETNLSHEGDCWIYNDAKCLENAIIYENAKLKDNAQAGLYARVGGSSIADKNAFISDYSEITDNAYISDDAKIGGKSKIKENAKILGEATVASSSEIKGAAVVDRLAVVHGATVSDNAYVTDESLICKGSRICGTSTVKGYSNIPVGSIIMGTDKEPEIITDANKDAKDIGSIPLMICGAGIKEYSSSNVNKKKKYLR